MQAGIPDFRSTDGLFQTLKRDNPKEAMTSGKELFDASVFNVSTLIFRHSVYTLLSSPPPVLTLLTVALSQSENKIALFYQMIAQLSDLSHAAEPTAFHNVLRALDNRGRLLRVYTQNIDAIEQKSGLSFGVPDFDCKRSKPKPKGKTRIPDVGDVIDATTELPPNRRLPSPPADTPRCIPLHGTLQSLHCQVCNHAFPLSEYLPSLATGQPPSCPECTNLELARKLVGKRPRGIGRLRPSVVLYNEEHKDGEGVGDVVQKDLMGGKGRSGADLLLVVGTSLKVPGTKRMVREFSKAVKARTVSSPSSKVETYSTTRSGGLATPGGSPRRTPTRDDDVQLPKSIYLNLDFPVPTREWEGVFDVWIQGDAQLFAETLRAEIDKEARAKEIASEKKKRKDEEASVQDELPDFGRLREMEPKKSAKRKLAVGRQRHIPTHSPSKKRKVIVELPRRAPPTSKRQPPQSPTGKFFIRLPASKCSDKSSHLATLRSCHQDADFELNDGPHSLMDITVGCL